MSCKGPCTCKGHPCDAEKPPGYFDSSNWGRWDRRLTDAIEEGIRRTAAEPPPNYRGTYVLEIDFDGRQNSLDVVIVNGRRFVPEVPPDAPR